MLPCPKPLKSSSPYITLERAWRQRGVPELCSEGSWIVNIGAAWQGSSSLQRDQNGKEVKAVGVDSAWAVMEWARDNHCPHVHAVAWEANVIKLKGLENVKLVKFNPDSKIVLVGGLATPASIAAAPELAPPLESRPRPHLLKVDIDSIDLIVVSACLRRFRPHLLVVEVNNFTPLPLDFAALYPTDAERAEKAPRYGSGYTGGNGKWPCWGASFGWWVRWLAQRHRYRLVTTDHNNNALFAAMEDEARPSVPKALGNFSDSAWCHYGMTVAELWRLRLCRRTDGNCAFRKRLRFPKMAPTSDEVAAHLTAFTPLLTPAVRSIYRMCDFSNVPFSLRMPNGECCPGAQPGQLGNGTYCRCSAMGDGF